MLPPQAEAIVEEMLAVAPPLSPAQQDALRRIFTPPPAQTAPAA